jgi:hypothetical protein
MRHKTKIKSIQQICSERDSNTHSQKAASTELYTVGNFLVIQFSFHIKKHFSTLTTERRWRVVADGGDQCTDNEHFKRPVETANNRTNKKKRKAKPIIHKTKMDCVDLHKQLILTIKLYTEYKVCVVEKMNKLMANIIHFLVLQSRMCDAHAAVSI